MKNLAESLYGIFQKQPYPIINSDKRKIYFISYIYGDGIGDFEHLYNLALSVQEPLKKQSGYQLCTIIYCPPYSSNKPQSKAEKIRKHILNCLNSDESPFDEAFVYVAPGAQFALAEDAPIQHTVISKTSKINLFFDCQKDFNQEYGCSQTFVDLIRQEAQYCAGALEISETFELCSRLFKEEGIHLILIRCLGRAKKNLLRIPFTADMGMMLPSNGLMGVQFPKEQYPGMSKAEKLQYRFQEDSGPFLKHLVNVPEGQLLTQDQAEEFLATHQLYVAYLQDEYKIAFFLLAILVSAQENTHKKIDFFFPKQFFNRALIESCLDRFSEYYNISKEDVLFVGTENLTQSQDLSKRIRLYSVWIDDRKTYDLLYEFAIAAPSGDNTFGLSLQSEMIIPFNNGIFNLSPIIGAFLTNISSSNNNDYDAELKDDAKELDNYLKFLNSIPKAVSSIMEKAIQGDIQECLNIIKIINEMVSWLSSEKTKNAWKKISQMIKEDGSINDKLIGIIKASLYLSLEDKSFSNQILSETSYYQEIKDKIEGFDIRETDTALAIYTILNAINSQDTTNFNFENLKEKFASCKEGNDPFRLFYEIMKSSEKQASTKFK